MIWTKLKKTAEALLSDALKERIEYHVTRYGNGVSDFMARGWVTFDGKEIANFSTIGRIRESYELTGEWYSTNQEAIDTLDKKGMFTRDDFVDALEKYVGMQVEDAIQSSNPIIRALAMFDRRLGKRRISTLSLGEDEHPLVVAFYKIRCQAEALAKE